MNIHRYRFYMHSVREKCVDHKSSRYMQMLAALVTLGYSTVISSQEPIIQISSLMHHISTPRTGMHNPNQCSKLSLKCQGHSDLLSVHNSEGQKRVHWHIISRASFTVTTLHIWIQMFWHGASLIVLCISHV